MSATMTHAAWAERLAQRRQQAHDVDAALPPRADAWIPVAIAVLWDLIETAVQEANSALQRAGLPERITVLRTDRERWLSAPGPQDGQRHIAIFVSLRAVEGQPSGGAHITTSETRAGIHLVPSVVGGRLRWTVPAAGVKFTAAVLEDLLLSVFGDDPHASRRLARFFTIDEFDET